MTTLAQFEGLFNGEVAKQLPVIFQKITKDNQYEEDDVPSPVYVKQLHGFQVAANHIKHLSRTINFNQFNPSDTQEVPTSPEVQEPHQQLAQVPDDKYPKLFANCLLTKGSSRSLICDTQRNQFTFIPNSLHEILTIHTQKTIAEIKRSYQNQYDETIDEYFGFLQARELIFFVDELEELERFPDIPLNYNKPTIIDHAIIDVNQNSKHDYAAIISQLDDLGCENLELRFFSAVTPLDLQGIFSYTNHTTIVSVDVIMPYSANVNQNDWIQLSATVQRIKKFTIYNAPTDQLINKKKQPLFLYTQQTIDNSSHCGFVSEDYLIHHIDFHIEARQFNTCLHKKISIDVDGTIKNCPALSDSFGKITEVSLHSALLDQRFTALWNINKDQVETCKDCEFRYACTDCRAYIQTPSNRYSKPSKCTYNPYIAVWE